MNDIEIYEDHGRRVISKRFKSPYPEIFRNWPIFAKEVRKQGFQQVGWGIVEFHVPGEWDPSNIEYDLMVPIEEERDAEPPLEIHNMKPRRAVSIVYRGNFGGLNEAYDRLFDFIEEKGLQVNGNLRMFHLRCPHNTATPEGYVTELQIGIE